MDRRDIRGAKKDVIEWAAFWEGNEMDFELKQLLHEEDDMVRIDLSKKIDENWVSNVGYYQRFWSTQAEWLSFEWIFQSLVNFVINLLQFDTTV